MCIYLLLLCADCSPQFLPGTRQISLSGSSTAISNDVFGMYGNPAAIAEISSNEAGVFYLPEPYGMKELAQYSFAYSHHFQQFNIATGFIKYGFSLYNESVISLSASKQFSDNFATGFTLNYNSLSIKNYGSKCVLTADFGVVFSISDAIKSGFSIRNFTGSNYTGDKDSKKIILNSGFSYSPVEAGTIYLGFQKESDLEINISGGIEILPVNFFILRIGAASYPQSFSAGFGLVYKILEFSYGMFTHAELGVTHSLGLIISFGSADK